MVNRRELLTRVIGGLLGSVLLARRAAAQALTDRLTLVTAGGTNVIVLATRDGLIVVDSGAADRTGALLQSLASLGGGAPVRTVFNTHWHLDHTAGNAALHERGATIVAHENTRLWMTVPTWMPAEDRYRDARPAAARPTQTFRERGALSAGDEQIDYGYLLEAHTSGDIYIHFRQSNVLAVGDVVSPARDPELDYFTGAWIGGRVDAMDRLLALADDRTRIVPGFGPVMNKAQLQAERDVMKTIYDRTVDRVREGESAADMFEAGVMNGLPRSWTDPRKFLYDVEKGLWAHHNKLAPNVV